MNPIPLIIISAAGAGTLSFFYHKGKALENKPITYDQFVEQLSRQIDQFMLKEERKKELSMYGGECEISIPQNEPQTVSMKIVLYGRNKKDSEKWTKSEIVQKINISDFTDDPDTVSQLESLKNKPEKFKITRPEKEK